MKEINLDNFTRSEISEIICDLNAWETPALIESETPLNEEQLRELFKKAEAIIPYTEWIKCWQKRIGSL